MKLVKAYWQSSRSPRYSVLFAMPLLLLYEALAALLSDADGGGVRNGADVLVKSVFEGVAGPYAPLLFGLVTIGGSIWIISRDQKRTGGRLRPAVFATMFAESLLLASAFGIVVGTITAVLLGQIPLLAVMQEGVPMGEMSAPTRLMVSLGAGLYEELVFRVFLVSGMVLLGTRVFRWERRPAVTVAVLAGAFIFSAFHYIGPYGDAFQLQSFVFRMVAGLFFSGLYVTRGFGITAWTHALYDVLVLLL